MNVRTRLLKGAQKLAEFWRAGLRCETTGWRLQECECATKTTFCGAKGLWLALLFQDPDLPVRGEPNAKSEFGLIDMMRLTELEATGFTVRTDAPKLKDVKIGPKGELSLGELLKMRDEPDMIPPILDFKAKFPGAQIESVEAPEEIPALEEGLV